jgi:solute carrier family 31 (copper transporter), member 1
MDRRHDDSSSMSMSDSHSMSGMAMFFTTSSSTPLYAESWTPSSTGAYAGTCIFLILLAITLRSLVAAKVVLEQRWAAAARNRRFVVVKGQQPQSERIENDPDAKTGSFVGPNGVEERVKYVQSDGKRALPFRLTTDLPRAALVTVIGGVSYLL